MADEVEHRIRLSDIRKIDGMRNHDRASLTPLFGELAAAVLTHDDPEKMVVTIGGLLDEAKIDYRDEASGDLLVSWWFRRTFRRMAAESNHWAILDRQTVFHLGSKYSVLLFQHIASLVNLDHVQSKTLTVKELRALLGVRGGLRHAVECHSPERLHQPPPVPTVEDTWKVAGAALGAP